MHYFIIVGPEGGLSRDEVAQARESGFISVSLGKQILKVETAAAAILSIIQYEKGIFSQAAGGGRKMTTYKFAGFWRRFVAYMIDGFIIGIVFIILMIVAGFAYFAGAMSGDSQAWIGQLTNPERMAALDHLDLAVFDLHEYRLFYLFSWFNRTHTR